MVRGLVQGVGFRPFVFTLARRLNLTGHVANTSAGVEIEVQGSTQAVEAFLPALRSELPPLARIDDVSIQDIDPVAETDFRILPSVVGPARQALVPADVAVCEACLAEFNDPSDRRYRYPFINCTHCGPRFTLIRATPYDRPLTTMSAFAMCPDCQAEYDDPSSRRFHAQPNACPVCGPRLWLADARGREIVTDGPLAEAASWLGQGRILAIRGLGGFHLACDATNNEAVDRLRRGKVRQAKPFAVMARDLDAVRAMAAACPEEEALLTDRRRPIVLLDKGEGYALAQGVSPRNGRIGVMLPYTPLHHGLLALSPPVLVMTSGNRAEEPMAYQNDEAVDRLGVLVDGFLLHDREIHNRCDDSLFLLAAGQPRPLRRGRGWTPEPLALPTPGDDVLAVGAAQKNAFCLVRGDQAFMGPHIGELETLETQAYFEQAVTRMAALLEVRPRIIACDRHPDYRSTRWALSQPDVEIVRVQHHHAHIAACLADNGRSERVIGLALDGTGYGDDGAVWGGEIFVADLGGFVRAAHLAYRPLPGGEAAVRQPWRMALSYLSSAWRAIHLNDEFDDFWAWIAPWSLRDTVGRDTLRTVFGQIRAGIQSPPTSSMGRLFDGVSSLCGLSHTAGYEGEPAVMLEAALDAANDVYIPLGYRLDWEETAPCALFNPDPLIQAVLADLAEGVTVAEISRRFHGGVVRSLTDACLRVARSTGLSVVALGGGCFQNRTLLEGVSQTLETSGLEVLIPRSVPVNDGGLALGQAAVARAPQAGRAGNFSLDSL